MSLSLEDKKEILSYLEMHREAQARYLGSERTDLSFFRNINAIIRKVQADLDEKGVVSEQA